jgi:hypothetical protein
MSKRPVWAPASPLCGVSRREVLQFEDAQDPDQTTNRTLASRCE